MFKKYLNWLFGKSSTKEVTVEATVPAAIQEALAAQEEEVLAPEVSPIVVIPEPAAEALAPRKPKKKYYKKKKPSNT